MDILLNKNFISINPNTACNARILQFLQPSWRALREFNAVCGSQSCGVAVGCKCLLILNAAVGANCVRGLAEYSPLACTGDQNRSKHNLVACSHRQIASPRALRGAHMQLAVAVASVHRVSTELSSHAPACFLCSFSVCTRSPTVTCRRNSKICFGPSVRLSGRAAGKMYALNEYARVVGSQIWSPYHCCTSTTGSAVQYVLPCAARKRCS